jgi:pimeloyl-ACP methyl ester carboxylesterase
VVQSAAVDHQRGQADERTQLLRLPDGRRLAFCEWGDAAGPAVLSLHGTPGSRYLRHVGSAYEDDRLRVVTYDRPGYGRSDPQPGRSVFETAADVEALADHLGIDTFAVAGVSAGGVHALAAAAALPDRVTRCVLIKPLAPYDADGLDFHAGMDPDGSSLFRAISEGDSEALAADAAETRHWIRAGMPGVDLPEDVSAILVEAFGEAYRQGLDGQVDDLAAHVRPHGYDVGSVTAPTWILAARDDVQAPPGHARWLAAAIPDALLTWVDGGHLDSPEDDEIRALAWAAHGLGQP